MKMKMKMKTYSLDIRYFAFTEADEIIKDRMDEQLRIHTPGAFYVSSSTIKRWREKVAKKYSIENPFFNFRFIPIKEISNEK